MQSSINHTLIALLCLWLALPAAGQENAPAHLWLEARGDYQRDRVDGSAVRANSGFKGRYLNVKLDGQVGPHWTYAYRQRLNKMHRASDFFDATDWLHIDYSPTERWTFSAGKQVVAIGGYEYDRAPIDLYFCSEFWNNIGCYQWGASAAYTLRGGHDTFVAQWCQSPFRSFYADSDMYAYNLMWQGRHGWYESLWSVNVLEWAQGRFISYLTLGNAFNFGPMRLELDFMNRATSHQTFLFRDCSVMAELSSRPSPYVRLHTKLTYDVNHADRAADLCVLPGTELTRVGCGAEAYPLRDERLRIHANWCYTFGTNGNPDGALRDRQSLFDLGITWRMDLLATARTIINRHHEKTE